MPSKLCEAAAKFFRSVAGARVITCLVTALAGLFLIEFAFNPGFIAALGPANLAANLQITLGLLLAVYFLGQQSRVALGVFLGACLVTGLANHYVTLFKGAPVLPSDLLAAGTAAQVSGGYSYAPDATVIASVVVLAACVAALVKLVPKVALTKKLVALNLVLGLTFTGLCAHQLLGYSLKDRAGVTVDVWYVAESYQSQGTLLCFMQRAQELNVHAPEGYSDEAVRALLGTDSADGTAGKADESTTPTLAAGASPAVPAASTASTTTAAAQSGQGAQAAAAKTSSSPSGNEQAGHDQGEKAAPVVICVMNETFADLTLWDELAGQESAYPANFYRIAQGSLLSGYTYVSAYAGGTCNSEFEFLTGMSCGNLGGGVYPYMVYSMDQTENLARWFSSLGYATTAMHPCPGSNWRRDVVYQQLGFDQFLDEQAFEGAPALRNKTTDKATYEKILQLLEENPETPQFIFDVTYQNHSGYSSGLVPEDLMVHAKINGTENSSLNEYLSVLQVADRDLGWFTQKLKELDRPVTLCFFGDHGPSLIGDLLNTGESTTLTEPEWVSRSQKKQTTPYLIWANQANATAVMPALAQTATAQASIQATTHGFDGNPAITATGTQANMSLNYLGVALAQATGLPTTPYQQFLARTYQQLPCANLHGVLTANGSWRSYDQTWQHPRWQASQALANYRIVQHGNLFGDRKAQLGYLRNASPAAS